MKIIIETYEAFDLTEIQHYLKCIKIDGKLIESIKFENDIDE